MFVVEKIFMEMQMLEKIAAKHGEQVIHPSVFFLVLTSKLPHVAYTSKNGKLEQKRTNEFLWLYFWCGLRLTLSKSLLVAYMSE